MSLYLDLKYINLITNRLEGFKRKSATLCTFRCPLCGDSQTKKSKTRGYFYQVPTKNFMSMKCHNCAASMHFSTFLKQLDPLQYGAYIVEKFKDTDKPKEVPSIDFQVPKDYFKEQKLFEKLLPRLDKLPITHPVVTYCIERKIPQDKFDRLFYIDDVSKIEQLSEKYRNKIEGTEPRLVIPAYNENMQLEGLTCRALGNEKIRYLSIKIKEDSQLIFGREHINKKERVYVVEGPIDSLFLPNCIAVSGTSFDKVTSIGVEKKNLTIILDNQPRNKEVCAIYNKIIKANFHICIWPQRTMEKDINEMVLNGQTPANVKALIDAHTHTGSLAYLEFVSWKRC